MSARDQVRERVRGLYVLLDAEAWGDPLRDLDAVLAGGCRLLQLRCKGWSEDELVRAARELVRRARPVGATIIVNDHAEVAVAADADGVHVGQLDASPEWVRRVLGPDRIVGRSTHGPEALVAAARDADYVAFGPVFPTARLSWAKPQQDLASLREARQRVLGRPLVAIGGIDAERLPSVKATGVDAWAVIGAVAGATDPGAAVRALR